MTKRNSAGKRPVKAPPKRRPLLEPPTGPPPAGELPLTPREERLAMLYAEGGKSLSECCRIVGLNPRSGDLYDRVKRGNIGQVVARRMRELGITLDAPLLKIRDFYDATKDVLNPTGLVLGEDGKTVKAAEIVALRDNESQRWAAEQTLKLLDAYPTEDVGGAGTSPAAVTIVFAGQAPQQVKTGIQIVTIQPSEGNWQGNGNGHRH